MSFCFSRPKLKSALLGLTSVFFSSVLLAEPSQIWINGDIHTSNPQAPKAQAFALENGKFVGVGSNEAVKALAGTSTQIVDLDGKTVIPGIIDGHFHLFGWYELSRGVNLMDINHIPTWVERVEAKAGQTPEGEWIVGGGWDHNAAGGQFPTAAQLDAVAPNHLVALGDIDHHTMWVNSKVLELFNITADTPSPKGGEIVKDPVTGEPTGILKETAAFMVWNSDAFKPKKADREKIWQEALQFVNSQGITGLHNMGDPRELNDLIEFVEQDRFPLRMWYGAFANSSDDVKSYLPLYRQINQRAQQQAGEGPRLAFGYIKTVFDGVMSSRTAALLDDYSDAPGEKGMFFIPKPQLHKIVETANKEDIPVAIHALGDGAVRASLDAFAASSTRPSLPNRIEHVELVTPTDMPRFKQLNVVASMQPQHAVMAIDPYVVQRIGPEREQYAYVWRKLLDSGAKLALSSDWPTASASPFAQLHAATTRQNLAGLPADGWHPSQSLSFFEALYAMTQQSADISGWGDEIGSITQGKWADFVVLDSQLSHPVRDNLLNMSVQSTYLAGGKVYQKSSNGNEENN